MRPSLSQRRSLAEHHQQGSLPGRTNSTRWSFGAGILLLGIVLSSIPADAEILGTASKFGVLAGSTVTNTGPSVIMGDVGVWAGSAITGFPPGSVVGGTLHFTDAVAHQAQSDNTTAYNALKGTVVTKNLTGKDLGGQKLTPGVYGFNSSAQLTGDLVLDAKNNPDALFIFNIKSTLTTGSASTVKLINGASGGNVFWLVGSSATLGSATAFTGNILALTSISLNSTASIICGSALAQTGAVTLINNSIIRPGLGGCVTTDTSGLLLLVNLGDLLSAATGLTRNQTAVAEAIAPNVALMNGNSVIAALGSLTGPQLAAALDAISGEGVSGAQQAAFGASDLFGSAVMGQATFWQNGASKDRIAPMPGPLKLGPSDDEGEAALVSGDRPGTWRVWATGFGGTTSLDGDKKVGSADLQSPTVGLASGIDYKITRSTLIGLAGGYSHSSFSVDERRTSGTVEGPHLGLYGVQWLGPVYLAGTADYAWFDNETERNIVLGSPVPTERANGDFSSEDASGRIEAGWEMSFGRVNVTPFGGLQWSRLQSDGFTERTRTLEGDAGIFALEFASQDETSRLSSLGAQLDTQLPLANGMMLSPLLRVAWVHEFNPDRSIFATLVSLPEASFTIDGAAEASDAAKVNTGLKLDVTDRTALFGFFDGVFSDQGQSYAGTGGVKILW